MSISVVGISGTLRSPSKTDRLLRAVLEAVEDRSDARTTVVTLLEHGHAIVDAFANPPSPELTETYERVLGADALVVATPVYKGSYTGLLKSFFDPIDQGALLRRPILPVAVGGDAQHSLVVDHELRPLFAFFGAAVSPRGIYGQASDFADDLMLSARLQEAVDSAADQLVAALSA